MWNMSHMSDSIGCNPLWFYWVMRSMIKRGSVGCWFITPRSAVRSRPPLPTFHFSSVPTP